jgi:catechol 2,3-dioxygenase-like lactoylglutathione lyase family enzyme
MLDHVGIRVSDLEASERFYLTVLSTLGIEQTYKGDELIEWDEFCIGDDGPVTRGLHVGFRAAGHADVDAFWQAGIDAGYRDDGAPGPRPQYVEDYYGAFLLDPDGNSVEAVWHGEMRGGMIDHLWLRVADVDASETSCTAAARRPPSRCCPARRPRTSTSPSPATMRPSRPSIAPPRRPGTATTAVPVSGRSTTPATTAPSCSIPTARMLRW